MRDRCRQQLSDFCSVTTGLLCTSFIVSLYLISLYRCHFPPPCSPPRHPATFVFPLQQQNDLVLSSNLDLKGQGTLFLSFWCFYGGVLLRMINFLITVAQSAVVIFEKLYFCNYLPQRLLLFKLGDF